MFGTIIIGTHRYVRRLCENCYQRYNFPQNIIVKKYYSRYQKDKKSISNTRYFSGVSKGKNITSLYIFFYIVRILKDILIWRCNEVSVKRDDDNRAT